MKIHYEEMSEEDFIKLDIIKFSQDNESPKSDVLIDNSKRVYANNENKTIQWDDSAKKITISFIQFEHEYFWANIKYFLSLIKIIAKQNADAHVVIKIYSNHFVYYRNEIMSLMYTNTTEQAGGFINYKKILLMVLIRKMFGQRVSHIFYKITRVIRKVIRR